MANYKYSELARWIREQITTGAFPVGGRIPSEMELADRFGLSRNTVRQALAVLEDEGLLSKAQGSGTFVSGELGGAGVRRFSGGGKCVGVVLNEANYSIFPRILEGINHAASQRGCTINMSLTFNHLHQEEQAIASMLRNEDLAGLIIEPAKSGLPPVNRAVYEQAARTVPCVFLHVRHAQVAVPSIQLADEEGYALLTRYLLERGHTNIATVGKLDEYTSQMRYLGHARELLRQGMSVYNDRAYWYVSDYLPQLFTEENAARLLGAIEGCTAVMCNDDRVAVNLIRLLQSHGKRVPDDVSVVGFDDSEYSEVPLTTVVHPKEELGKKAVEALFRLMENPGADVSYQYNPVLVERGSVRRLL